MKTRLFGYVKVGLIITSIGLAMSCMELSSGAKADTQTEKPALSKETIKFLKSRIHNIGHDSGLFFYTPGRTPQTPVQINASLDSGLLSGYTAGQSVATYIVGGNTGYTFYYATISDQFKFYEAPSSEIFSQEVQTNLYSLGCRQPPNGIVSCPVIKSALIELGASALVTFVSDKNGMYGQSICPSGVAATLSIFSAKNINFQQMTVLDTKSMQGAPVSDIQKFLHSSYTHDSNPSAGLSWGVKNVFACGAGEKDGFTLGARFVAAGLVMPMMTAKNEAAAPVQYAQGKEPKVKWNSKEKEMIKNLIEEAGKFATPSNAAMTVFTALANDEGKNAKENFLNQQKKAFKAYQENVNKIFSEAVFTSSPSYDGNPVLRATIPQGAPVFDLKGFLQSDSSSANSLGCPVSRLFNSDDARCRSIALLLIRKLKISAMKIDSQSRPLSPVCSLIQNSFTILDDRILLYGQLLDFADNASEALENLKMVARYQTLLGSNFNSDVDFDQSLDGQWALQNGYISCKPPKSIDIEKEFPGLRADALKITEVLPHDVTVFHWQRSEAIIPGDAPFSGPGDARVNEYLKSMTTRFWKSPTSGGSGGSGLYFALDPSSTSGYGDGLLKVVLKKGIRHFEFYSGAKLSKESVEELRKAECNVEDWQSLYYRGEFHCALIAKALTKNLGIAFVHYVYGNNAPVYCTKRYPYALVVFDPIAFDKSKSLVLVKAGPKAVIPPASVPEAVTIYKIMGNGYYRNTDFGLSAEKLKTITDDEVMTWAKANLMGCMP